ncbi:hypothetical protein F7725_000469, partial [Dissostichus mawsoni]
MKTPSALQRSGVRDSDAMMSAKVNMEAPPKEPDRTPLDPSSSSASLSSSEAVLVCGSDGVAKKARPQTHTTTAFLLPAPAAGHQKLEVTPAISVGDAGKGGRANETTTLTAQVGGACSIVHVLEWKEGMAILPSSNLKFCVSDVGTLSTLISPGTTSSTEPAAGTSGRSCDAETAPSERPDVLAPLGSVRGAVEPERFVPVVKHEVQVGPGHQNHDPRAQRSYTEELRREPITDKRSIGVEKVPAGGRVSSLNPDHLKPMRKRKRKEYLSPSEEDSDIEGTDEKTDDSKADCRLIRGAGDSKTEQWTWAQYLEETKSVAAPNNLFQETQRVPTVKNGFKQGMKLEGIDPQHPSMYFVLTVAEVCGYRLRLHFDGYSDCHDFWVNANSPDIHPTGWCESTGHKLHTPKGCKEEEFTWANYLRMTKAQVAPKELFASLGRVDVKSSFEIGTKLEAVDRMNPSLICVATVTDVVDDRFLVHFDNWDDTLYEIAKASQICRCDSSSPYIHPIGWCQERDLPLTPPKVTNYPDQARFIWSQYLEETGSKAVAADAFKVRAAHSFQTQMKLEAVDKRSPGLIRVASVMEVEIHRIRVHYDGWSHVYDEWMDSDHPDIHQQAGVRRPITRSKFPRGTPKHSSRTGAACTSASPPTPPLFPVSPSATESQQIQLPQQCPTPGCDGSGHVTGRFTAHHCISGCPLAERNQGRLKAELSDSECKRTVFLSQRPKKTHYRGSQMFVCACLSSDLSSEGVYPSLFMSALSGQTDRTLSLCWEQHCKLLPGVQGIHASQVAAWSVEEVFMFVQNLIGCEEQACLFKEEMIDGEAFLLLTQTDIVKIMSIKLGPALKISNAILMFKSTDEVLKEKDPDPFFHVFGVLYHQREGGG